MTLTYDVPISKSSSTMVSFQTEIEPFNIKKNVFLISAIPVAVIILVPLEKELKLLF